MALNTSGETGPSQEKFAIRKLVKGKDGLMTIIYVDAATGKQLESLEGYIVYSPNEAQRLGITRGESGVTSVDDDLFKDRKSTASQIKQGASYESADPINVGGGRKSRGLFDRSPGNNYGYINTPDWLTLAGFLPVVGGPAKMADRAAGLNNTAAANKARETMGLDKMGGIRTAGNILGLRDESVAANVKIGENPYSVGMEAVNKKGQTTLTPSEARQRSLVTGKELTEMKPSESRAWEKETGAKSGGFIPGMNRNEDTGYSVDDFPAAPGGYTGPTMYTDDPFGAMDQPSQPDNSNSNPGSDSNSYSPSGGGGLDGWDGYI